MTEVGEYGRLPPGESWRRAVDEAFKRASEPDCRRRYTVWGRQLGPDWWTYEVRRGPRLGTVAPPPMTAKDAQAVAADLPRCAQRARNDHGGQFKAAWPSVKLVQRAAEAMGMDFYRCSLPAPALGEHWHMKTPKKRRKA